MEIFRASEPNSIIVSVKDSVEHLHKGIAQDEQVLLPILMNVKWGYGCHAILVSLGVYIIVKIHKVMRGNIIPLFIDHKSQSTKVILVAAILDLRELLLNDFVGPCRRCN